jgi:hypothetical protein
MKRHSLPHVKNGDIVGVGSLEHCPRMRVAQLGLASWGAAVLDVTNDDAREVRAVGRSALGTE